MDMHTHAHPGPWGQALRDGALGGTVASLCSAAAMVLLARREDRGQAAAPINAVSHWIWPHQAFREDRPSWKYTGTGLAIHQGAGLFWGVLHARAQALRPDAARQPLPALAGGLAAAALACFVDYKLTPQRLQPGYEARLSRGALALGYGAFGLGLGLSALLLARMRED
ncbi:MULTISPECIES: hypothetical protein [Ramlibacter]|uniref:Uncharacterized protein n=1 Tax=Ramlibacter aquaticus TaxID=2780094 RepID=A0ABR9SJ50_9BURK|nr:MULTISPECIES: hypothetical protein [Ramlibacter]MBE7941929.1 hypothetical protein [Ramlibacter aquaticus]